MPLPTPQKTHQWDSNNRSVFASLAQVMRDVLFGIKEQIKTESTVKGSSDGTTAAMAGADVWTNAAAIATRGANTTSPQAWIVLEPAGMGGAEILIAWQGGADHNAKVAISPGGLWTLAGTPTHQPTAADEVIVHANTASFINSTASADRIWNCDITSDGSSITVLIARSSVWVEELHISMAIPSTFGGSAAWSPSVYGWSRQGASDLANLFTAANTQCRTNGGGGYANATAFHGVEGYAAVSAPSRTTFAPEMQGSEFLLYPCSLWSETVNARGKLGNVVDMWVGLVSAADGDTYPNDATRQFIQVGDVVFKWDGSAVVMA